MGTIMCYVLVFLATSVLNGQADLSDIVQALSRQIMLQDLAVQEKVRSEGDSGIKLIRMKTRGTHSYISETFSGHSVASIHDHSNHIRTVGMGELIAVLNGVEFRTRHNDYMMNKPSSTSTDLNAVEDIEYPDTPPAVLAKTTVEEQIDEMHEWFRAWQNQDDSVRDYKPYFPAVLCYLEGGWTVQNLTDFFSDRHQIDASSWFELAEKIRFSSYVGTMHFTENFAHLPRTIINLLNGTYPEFAHWTYRIHCHPIEDDLPLNRIHMVDDLTSRMRFRRSMQQQVFDRGARFQLNPKDRDKFWRTSYKSGLLDDIMSQIPGKDNYPGYIEDVTFDQKTFEFNSATTPLNVAYYHRIMRLGPFDYGKRVVNRGFSDQNLFIAYNSQPKMSEMRVKVCKAEDDCAIEGARVSYAIPLEIIYLTPLYNWNPYGIVYKGESGTSTASTVKLGGRTGEFTQTRAYNGTHSQLYYRIPVEFFTGLTIGPDSADTTLDVVGVLDENGVVRNVTASGTRIILPHISDIGQVRVRYPIMPAYDDGNNIRKEVEALKEIVMDMDRNRYMLYKEPHSFAYSRPAVFAKWLKTAVSTDGPYPEHFHYVPLTDNDIDNLKKGRVFWLSTRGSEDHSHTLYLRLEAGVYKIMACDDRWSGSCWHDHGTELIR